MEFKHYRKYMDEFGDSPQGQAFDNALTSCESVQAGNFDNVLDEDRGKIVDVRFKGHFGFSHERYFELKVAGKRKRYRHASCLVKNCDCIMHDVSEYEIVLIADNKDELNQRMESVVRARAIEFREYIIEQEKEDIEECKRVIQELTGA